METLILRVSCPIRRIDGCRDWGEALARSTPPRGIRRPPDPSPPNHRQPRNLLPSSLLLAADPEAARVGSRGRDGGRRGGGELLSEGGRGEKREQRGFICGGFPWDKMKVCSSSTWACRGICGIRLDPGRRVHAYERSNRVYNYSFDSCAPVYITVGDGGNREKRATSHADDPEHCPDPLITPDQYMGGFCAFNFTTGPAAGKFCWNRQPDYSANRESSFGHGILGGKE